jgi:thioredoxin 1
VLVDFWQGGCIWCKRLDPELNAIMGDFSGKVKLARLNIFSRGENNEIAGKYGIMGTPTLLLFWVTADLLAAWSDIDLGKLSGEN